MIPVSASDLAILGRYSIEGWFWDTRNNKVFRRVIHYADGRPYIVYKGEWYATRDMQLFVRER